MCVLKGDWEGNLAVIIIHDHREYNHGYGVSTEHSALCCEIFFLSQKSAGVLRHEMMIMASLSMSILMPSKEGGYRK